MNQDISVQPRPNTAEELAQIPYEPLLPVEKKLIVTSLLIGLLLLGLLVWISQTYFPATSLTN